MIQIHILDVLILQLELCEVSTQLAHECSSRERNGDSLLSEYLIQFIDFCTSHLVSVRSSESPFAQCTRQEAPNFLIMTNAERHRGVLSRFPVDVDL